MARNAIVIEFSGTPKAGKTTTLSQLQAFLKRCGFRVEVVVERASVCPIRDKKHANFNVWTACTTLAQILEKTQNPPRQDDPNILILDRGLFDSICWLRTMEHLTRIRKSDREIVERFLLADDWRKRIAAVIVMTSSPTDAMKREYQYLPLEGTAGSIMNVEVLQQMLTMTRNMTESLGNQFRIYTVDTSSGDTKDNPKRTVEVVVDIVLSLIEEHLQEDILCLPKTAITTLFRGRHSLKNSDAASLSRLFTESGKYQPREVVEKDAGLVQALPVVIVRNRSGDVLQLRRRERVAENPLHQEVVIWAGGHVRKEDASNGNSLLQCAVRELQEELRLSIQPSDLKLLGAVYMDVGERTSKHAALVYEWRAETDDVAVALSNAEFFERRGTSLSGRFVGMDELMKDVLAQKTDEPWSVEIVQEFLASGPSSPMHHLF